MQLATLLLLASSTSAAAVGAAGRRLRAGATTAERAGAGRDGELLCRVRPGDGAGGRPLDVWLLPGNARAVAFEDALTYEALVHCNGGQPECRPKQAETSQLFGVDSADLVPDDVVGSIEECPECPCEMDVTQRILESQRDIVDAVQPRCTSARRGKPVDVLMIGLGGGIVHSLVRKSCPEGTRVRSVEIDARFAAAAGRYFGLPLRHGASEVVVGDAFAVVEGEAAALKQRRKSQKQPANRDGAMDEEPPAPALGAEGYDVVVVDCFVGGGETPEACRSGDFIDDLKSILKPGGEVIQHLWHRSPQKPVVASQYKSTRQDYDDAFGADSVKVRSIFRQNQSLMFDDLVFATKKK